MKVISLLMLLARWASSTPEAGKTLVSGCIAEGFLMLVCKFLEQVLSSFIVYFNCAL